MYTGICIILPNKAFYLKIKGDTVLNLAFKNPKNLLFLVSHQNMLALPGYKPAF
jgi:hypothetical protein